eukprot:scaffold5160_cov152-Cylindrotheca_fusiformis.AAC.3
MKYATLVSVEVRPLVSRRVVYVSIFSLSIARAGLVLKSADMWTPSVRWVVDGASWRMGLLLCSMPEVRTICSGDSSSGSSRCPSS